MADLTFPFVDPPRADQFQPCIKCGLCLDSCPTFQETGRELESPRGRVQLIAAVARGVVPLGAPKLAETLFSCLDCRACEVACPSGVPIGSLIERGRGQVVAFQRKHGTRAHRKRSVGFATRWAVKSLLPDQNRVRRLTWVVGRAQRLGLLKSPGRYLVPVGMRRMAEGLPRIPSLGRAQQAVSQGESSAKRVGVFSGCVMDAVFADANQATIRVLDRNRLSSVVPLGQNCCGALAIHAGEREAARTMARRNIDAFLADDLDYIATNAGGCGAALLEYPEWLADDPEYRERAKAFSAKVLDVAMILEKEGWQVPTTAISEVVTYQASCHLNNVMKAARAPVNILRVIPGLVFREMEDSARCCGSAGIYNLTHPEMAEALLRRKMDDVPEDVETIVTGNPGCWLQLLHGVQVYRPGLRVRHLVQVLDDAYERERSTPVATGASE